MPENEVTVSSTDRAALKNAARVIVATGDGAPVSDALRTATAELTALRQPQIVQLFEQIAAENRRQRGLLEQARQQFALQPFHDAAEAVKRQRETVAGIYGSPGIDVGRFWD